MTSQCCQKQGRQKSKLHPTSSTVNSTSTKRQKKRGGAAFVCVLFCYFPIISNSAAISGAQCHAQRSNSPISTFNPPSSKFKSIQSSNSTQPCPKSTNKSTGSCFALLSPAFQAKKMTKKKVWRDGKQLQKTQTSVFPFRNKKGSSFNSHFVGLYRIMVANKQKQRRLIIEEEEKAQQKRSEDSLSCQVGALCRMNWQVA